MEPGRELPLGPRLRMLTRHRPECSGGCKCGPHDHTVHIALTKPSHRQGFVDGTPGECPRVLDSVDPLLVYRRDKPAVDDDGGEAAEDAADEAAEAAADAEPAEDEDIAMMDAGDADAAGGEEEISLA